MHDSYQMPALVLTALLLPTYWHLYWRTRDTRNLLWFLAFLVVILRMLLLYPLWPWAPAAAAWASAVGEALSMLAAGLFLGSLSPLTFPISRVRILYVVPFLLPLIVFALLTVNYQNGSMPHGWMFWAFPGLGLLALIAEMFWDHAAGGSLPRWTGTVFCVLFGGLAFWFYFRTGLYWTLTLAETAMHLMTALLVVASFRRLSPGVLVSVLGFVAWSMPMLQISPLAQHDHLIGLMLARLIIMAKVAAALGLILLALENELAANTAARDREHRVRCELEAYHRLQLSKRRVEEFDRQADEICQAVEAQSRFARAALILLQPTGMYQMVGVAGFDMATSKALNALAVRLPVTGFLAPGSAPVAVPGSQTVVLDLRPWFTPGDDLERLNCSSLLAVPMMGRAGAEGALLLDGLRNPDDSLRADDLAPVETLAARLHSVRSQTRMLEKLIDSEKFAGLGQLAGNVTQQLNNPLTVVLGYASLLEDSPELGVQERRAVESILVAGRSMRMTIESLQRIACSPGGHFAAVSVASLLADMERLHRSEFLQRSIDFRVNVEPDLPRVLCQEQQLRQAVLHCLQFAMEAVNNVEAESERLVRLEASVKVSEVQIVISHTGPAFDPPSRAFDPFTPPYAGAGETAGLGLSLCATILRDNNGRVMAVNLEPRGAAMILELPAA